MKEGLQLVKVEECVSSAITVTEDGVRLPETSAIAVMLSNWNVDDDPTFPIKPSGGAAIIEEYLQEIYWGFRGVYAHQLFPSQSTEIIPVTNLKDVCLRSRPGQTVTIWYSYWQ